MEDFFDTGAREDVPILDQIGYAGEGIGDGAVYAKEALISPHMNHLKHAILTDDAVNIKNMQVM